jgi:hypothetical protein
MGGNAFDFKARRLTTPQIEALLEHVKAALTPLVPGPIDATRYFTKEKTSHGDLDIQVGIHAAGSAWKGNVTYEPKPAGSARSLLNGNWKQLINTEGAVWAPEDVKDFFQIVGEALGAKEWKRNGEGGNFAVRCGVLGQHDEEVKADDVSPNPL